jgi:heptosyltransferase-2
MAAEGGPRRVVVRPPNWLGDAVLALPALAAVRRHFADAHLTIAAAPAVAAVFREETDAAPDAVIEVPGGSRAAVATLRAGRFDVAVLFPNSFGSAWQVWRARVPERWGYATSGRGWLLTRRARPIRGSRRRHQAEHYRDLALGLGLSPAEELPRLAPTAASREEAGRLVAAAAPDSGPLIGMAPGAAYGQAKQWPPERMAAVAARLIEQDGATVVLVGATHDRDAARAIESWLRLHAPGAAGRLVNLAGRTSLGALIGLIARMTAFISNDSGAMHVAAALGRPVVVVFGPTDERRTRPLGDQAVLHADVFCRPCMLRDCPIDHRCMTRVTVDDVYAAVSARLGVRP